MGLLTPCFVPGEGFLYTIIVPGGGFLLPSSRVPGVCPGGGWFWMKLIPALFGNCNNFLLNTVEIFQGYFFIFQKTHVITQPLVDFFI